MKLFLYCLLQKGSDFNELVSISARLFLIIVFLAHINEFGCPNKAASVMGLCLFNLIRTKLFAIIF